MGYVMPRRRGKGASNEWNRQGISWKEDYRELMKEQDRQHDADLAEMDKDNATHDPLWPEEQYGME